MPFGVTLKRKESRASNTNDPTRSSVNGPKASSLSSIYKHNNLNGSESSFPSRSSTSTRSSTSSSTSVSGLSTGTGLTSQLSLVSSRTSLSAGSDRREESKGDHRRDSIAATRIATPPPRSSRSTSLPPLRESSTSTGSASTLSLVPARTTSTIGLDGPKRSKTEYQQVGIDDSANCVRIAISELRHKFLKSNSDLWSSYWTCRKTFYDLTSDPTFSRFQAAFSAMTLALSKIHYNILSFSKELKTLQKVKISKRVSRKMREAVQRELDQTHNAIKESEELHQTEKQHADHVKSAVAQSI